MSGIVLLLWRVHPMIQQSPRTALHRHGALERRRGALAAAEAPVSGNHAHGTYQEQDVGSSRRHRDVAERDAATALGRWGWARVQVGPVAPWQSASEWTS